MVKAFLIFFILLSLNHDSPEKPDMPKPDYVAFQPGEELDFDLKYSFIYAGFATFKIDKDLQDIGGRKHFHIKVHGQSSAFFNAFYKIYDDYETFVDQNTLLPSVYIRNIDEGGHKKKEGYIFDRDKNKVLSGNNEIPVPPNIFDIISVFYYGRCLDFSKYPSGTDMSMNTIFDEKIFPVGVKFLGNKVISTKLGKFNCRVFKPKLIKGKVFQNQDDMTIYVSDDQNHIPLRIESAVYFDFVHADLTSYKNLKYPLTSRLKD
jgi:hypothetical protein